MYTQHCSNATVPCMLEGHGRSLYYIPYEYGTMLGPEKWWRTFDFKEEVFLYVADNWTYSIYVAMIYAIGIHVIQKTMANRKAFELKWPFIIWNAAIALFSFIGAVRTSEELIFVMRTRPLLDTISYATDPEQPAGFWAVCFTFSKILELADTIFIVLRKKRLHFLHWYHHAIVLVGVWMSATEMPAMGRPCIFMNFAVHSVMYAYYACTAAGLRFPRIVPRTIFAMEATQMLTGVALSFIVYYYKSQGRLMQQSFENLQLGFIIYASFTVLYLNFFIRSRMRKEKLQ